MRRVKYKMMGITFFIGCLIISITSCKKDPTLPQVITDGVSNITYESAITGGNVTSGGGAPVTARGVCWSVSENPTTSDSLTNNGSGTGSFTSEISGLTGGNTYYVRAYATNSIGTAYGDEISFTAGQVPLADVTTDEMISTGIFSATAGGNIVEDRGLPVIERGVCWHTAENPTIDNNRTKDGSGTGTFISELNKLDPGTTYYLRAYASNKLVTAYGNQITFTTRADNNASRKELILEYLDKMPASDKIICGQSMEGYNEFNLRFYNGLLETTGKLPGLMGFDLYLADPGLNPTPALPMVINHANSGGLVTMSLHMSNPATGGNPNDRNFTSADFKDIIDNSTATNANFRVQLNKAVVFLRSLRDNNVIVLVRPFHEMNGGWFWWGNGYTTKAEYISLWNYTYDYLTVTWGLDNLLFVYSPNYIGGSYAQATDYYYPGDDKVDIVGLDYYQDHLDRLNNLNGYTQIKSLGKPVALCETGPKPTYDGTFDNLIYTGIKAKYPEICYFMVWPSWKVSSTEEVRRVAIIDCANAYELMNHEGIITLDEMSLGY